jgi:hypothetical protein
MWQLAATVQKQAFALHKDCIKSASRIIREALLMLI